MGRLSKSKKEKLIRTETARSILDKHLEDGFITEQDLISLIHKNINYGIKTSGKKYDYKSSILKDIFNCPFLLCDQNHLSSEIKRVLPDFLNSRYESEKKMLEFYLNECYIIDEEYYKELDELEFVYYKSSNDGKNIQKTGKILSDIQKVKQR